MATSRRKPRKEITYSGAPYPFTVHLVTSSGRFAALVDPEAKYVACDDDRGVCGDGTPGLGLDYIVGVFDGNIRTLVHECSHATLRIFERIGLDPVSGQGEAFCYFLEDMVAAFKDDI